MIDSDDQNCPFTITQSVLLLLIWSPDGYISILPPLSLSHSLTLSLIPADSCECPVSFRPCSGRGSATADGSLTHSQCGADFSVMKHSNIEPRTASGTAEM